MKKLIPTAITLLTIAILITSCKGTDKEKNPEGSKPVKTEQKGVTIHLTKAEFLTKVVDYETNPKVWKYLGAKPCIVDFYATWCGPCKSIAPILEDLAREYEGKIYIYKIDTDAEPELAAAFGIQSIPTLIFCPMTGNPQIAQGAMTKDGFKKVIDEFLLKQ